MGSESRPLSIPPPPPATLNTLSTFFPLAFLRILFSTFLYICSKYIYSHFLHICLLQISTLGTFLYLLYFFPSFHVSNLFNSCTPMPHSSSSPQALSPAPPPHGKQLGWKSRKPPS